MKNVICILLLFCCCTICNAQSCYQETRAKGISLYNQKKYKEAINVFEAAKDCPDKPAAHDLNAMIKNCRDAISAQEEKRRQAQEEERSRQEQEEAKRKRAAAITLFEQSNETTRLASNSKENALSRGEWRTLMNKAFDHVTSSYDNQDSYKGEKSDNRKSRLGVYRWSAGSYHWGKLSMDNFNGVGIYITSQGFTLNNCPDCCYYVGEYSNDQKEGEGTCYDRYGNLIYYGNFSNNVPTGTYPSTKKYSSYKFECFTYSNGNMYIGETQNGKRHGKGIFLWKGGDAWYGEWTDGKRDGKGIHMYYDGSITVGRWNDDTYTAN